MSIFPSPSPGSGSGSPPPPPTSAPPPTEAPPQYYAAPPQYYAPPPAASGSGKIWALFAAIVLLIGANVYLYMQLDAVKKDLVKASDLAQNRLDKLEESTSLTTRTNRKTADELKEQLERARRQANAAAGEAKEEALKKVDETKAELEAAQERDKQQLTSDISQVRQSADTANTKVAQVDTAVTGVKSDVAQTRSELEKTVAELKRATGGDLSVRLTAHPLAMGVIAVDATPSARTSSTALFAEYYTYQARGEPKFVLQLADMPWFDNLYLEAEALWAGAADYNLESPA